MFNACVTCIRGDYDHGEPCPDHAEDPCREGARRALAWGRVKDQAFKKLKNFNIPNFAQHLRNSGKRIYVYHKYICSPMPELSKTPQANQIAEVRLSDSSSFNSLGSMLYLQ